MYTFPRAQNTHTMPLFLIPSCGFPASSTSVLHLHVNGVKVFLVEDRFFKVPSLDVVMAGNSSWHLSGFSRLTSSDLHLLINVFNSSFYFGSCYFQHYISYLNIIQYNCHNHIFVVFNKCDRIVCT